MVMATVSSTPLRLSPPAFASAHRQGGGKYQQHCGWFVHFNDHDKITRIVQYDDTKLVDDMTLRVATARMRALQTA